VKERFIKETQTLNYQYQNPNTKSQIPHNIEYTIPETDVFHCAFRTRGAFDFGFSRLRAFGACSVSEGSLIGGVVEVVKKERVFKADRGNKSIMGSIAQGDEEELLSRIKSLGKRELREVMDFIDALQERREQTADPFFRYLKERADRQISLAQVRQELSPIKGNLSDTISKQREERG